MALGARMRQGLGLAWRGIYSAVSKGRSVFNFASREAQVFAAENIPTSMIDTSVIDQLAAFAGGLEQAKTNIATAAGSDMIDASMVARIGQSMDLNQFNTSPNYYVELGLWIEGLDEPQYRTITDVGTVNMTVDQFTAMMRLNAEGLQYGTVPGGGLPGRVIGIASMGIYVAPARLG